jgi:hypothetical protein
MSLRSSARFVSIAVASTIVPAVVAFAPAAAAQAIPPATAPAAPATPKKEDSKPADTTTSPAGTTPGTTAPATGPTSPTQTDAAVDTSAMKSPSEAAAAGNDIEQRRAIYVSVDFGFARADVGGLSDNTGFDKTGANGIMGGLGIGYRLNNLRIGGRFRDASTTEFELWSLVGEIGYGLPLRPITPVIFVHGGYMFDSGIQRSVVAKSVPAGNVLTPNLGLDGAVLGAELLGNIHLSQFLRLGPFIGFDLTWLHRKQVGLPQSIVPLTDDTKNNPLYTDSGSGVGYVFTLGIRGTGDIAF